MSAGAVSIGVAGSLGPERIARLAPAVEAAGFASLWVNDTPDGDAIAALAAAAKVTERLTLATGVVPVDRRPAAEIVAAVRAAEMPPGRVMLGIGSGASRDGALGRVREAVTRLREELSCRVVVGALGPRMRRLGAGDADGVVLNWLTPETAAAQSGELHAASPTAHVALYVRTALDPAAFGRLHDETARYASSPNYAANFERLGIDARDTVIEGEEALRRSIPAYRDAVDEVVLRAMPAGDEDADYFAFIERAAPATG